MTFSTVTILMAVLTFGAVMVREAVSPTCDWMELRRARIEAEFEARLADYKTRHPEYAIYGIK